MLAAADGGQQRAVADEVGIAADRRGEMAVVGGAEAGVAAVLRGVGGLLEGAQEQRGQRRAATIAPHVRLDPSRDLPHQLRGLRGRHVLRQRRRRHVERRELVDEALHALGLGAFVHTIKAGRTALGEQPRDRFVGGDHQVLDQAVGLGLQAYEHLLDMPVFVEDELRLGGVERQRTAVALAPILLERCRRGPRGRQRPGPRLACALAAGEDLIDLLVAQALVRADQRAVEGGLRDRCPVQLELDRHRRALFPRHERAGVVGERLRQHRLDRARHIHARAATPRLQIDERTFGHIGADVRDVNPHARGLGEI